jgi:hypothetical protein
MNVPEGVLRSYRPCRAKPQPPSGCNGQCARAAERQSSRVTYSSPASPVSNRSCTGTGPAGMPPARAHLLKAQRQVGELTQSRRPQPRQAAQRSSGHRAPGTVAITLKAQANVDHGHRPWTCGRCAGAHRHGPWTTLTRCPPPAPSPTCPPPPTTVRSKDPIQSQCHCALHHRQWTSRGHAPRQERCGES